ncbi:MAG: universal stress protein [Hyphomicrobiales bacterium]
MPKIVVAMDGSEHAIRALHYAIDRARMTPGSSLAVVNVQAGIPASVTDFVGSDAVEGFHRDQADAECNEARTALAEATDVPSEVVFLVGSPAEAIDQFVRETGGEELVMGRRGLGTLGSILMGSVATRILHLVDVPVTLVK